MTPSTALPSARASLVLDADYFDVLSASIRSARTRIWATQFSLNMQVVPDGHLQVRSIARALAGAASRGVDVRILAGGNARRPLTQPAGNDLTLAFLQILGVDARGYTTKAAGGSHAKYVLVDADLVLVGSHNWSPRAFGAGVDSTLAVKSETAAEEIATVFERAWKRAARPQLQPELEGLLPQLAAPLKKKSLATEWSRKPVAKRLTYSGAAVGVLVDKAYHRALLKGLAKAQRSIDVSMFYFSHSTRADHPNAAISKELVRAKERGVKVRILLDVDRPGDLYNSRRINADIRRFLVRKGIAVMFDAPETVNHSKFVAIDDERVLLGSHNWTRNSQESLHELSLAVESKVIAQQCSELVSSRFADV